MWVFVSIRKWMIVVIYYAMLRNMMRHGYIIRAQLTVAFYLKYRITLTPLKWSTNVWRAKHHKSFHSHSTTVLHWHWYWSGSFDESFDWLNIQTFFNNCLENAKILIVRQLFFVSFFQTFSNITLISDRCDLLQEVYEIWFLNLIEQLWQINNE